jgi:putative SOS response-associated peptidase YedK
MVLAQWGLVPHWSKESRMPAIIAPAHYDLWLDSRVSDKQEIMHYLTSAPSSQLTAYPVSTWVNVPKYDDERCIQPAV